MIFECDGKKEEAVLSDVLLYMQEMTKRERLLLSEVVKVLVLVTNQNIDPFSFLEESGLFDVQSICSQLLIKSFDCSVLLKLSAFRRRSSASDEPKNNSNFCICACTPRIRAWNS
jgi:hypothetical protein